MVTTHPSLDTAEQLKNRSVNASLLRYVDSMRIHGHRAARIDPLDLIHREEVAALSPTRYGLGQDQGEQQQYNVDGIVWTRPVGSGKGEDLWSLEDIVKTLEGIYVGRIGYEVTRPCRFPSYQFLMLPNSSCTPPPRLSASGSLTCSSPSPCHHQRRARLPRSVTRRSEGYINS
jgi:probable 2-oxoglutarate dehydrogenase E1 component DHKTD1